MDRSHYKLRCERVSCEDAVAFVGIECEERNCDAARKRNRECSGE